MAGDFPKTRYLSIRINEDLYKFFEARAAERNQGIEDKRLKVNVSTVIREALAKEAKRPDWADVHPGYPAGIPRVGPRGKADLSALAPDEPQAAQEARKPRRQGKRARRPRRTS